MQNKRPNKVVKHRSASLHWTEFKSRLCGFAAQKYSTKPQLKFCRLPRRYVFWSDTGNEVEYMNKVFTVFIAVLFFTGCAMQSGYELSAREMLNAEYVKPNLGFLKSWKPLGKNYEYKLSEHEIAQSALDMEACVNQLSSKYPNPPKHALRSFQIIKCMKGKSWSFEIEEILIMR